MSITKQFGKQKIVFNLLILILVLVLQGSSVTAETQITEPDEPSEVAATETVWDSIQNITNNTFGSRAAVVRGAPNGRTVIVGYVRQMSDLETNTDVYYRRSTTNGVPGGWSSEAQIHSSPGIRSAQLDLDYDSANKAHAVWVENLEELHYASETSWASNASTPLSININRVATPRIVASGISNIDVVWAEHDGTNWQIYHTRSKNGGSSWAVAKSLVSVGSTDISTRPALAVTGNTVHVVWEEGVVFAGVQYAQGTVNNSTNTVSWTTRRTISTASAATNAKQPQATLSGNILHVAYTERFGTNQQYIHHIQCSANCSSSNVNANWLSQGNPVSGQALGVHASTPFDVVSTIDQLGSCTLVYFHGRILGGTVTNEQIWGTSNCGNWATSPKDEVTTSGTRAIYPSIEAHNNWWVYVVYEEFVSEDIHQVRFVRNEPGIYLPLVVK